MKHNLPKLALGRVDIVNRLAALLDPELFHILIQPLNRPTEEYKALLDYFESDRAIKLGLKKQAPEPITELFGFPVFVSADLAKGSDEWAMIAGHIEGDTIHIDRAVFSR